MVPAETLEGGGAEGPSTVAVHDATPEEGAIVAAPTSPSPPPVSQAETQVSEVLLEGEEP